jgi:probable F420-dependent oxidoreductase
VLGLGIGHARSVGEAYRQPLRKLGQYLDELDAASPPVPADGRAIAALGPRALKLARERSAGSLPYLTTPDHTRFARETLGPDALLATEQKVVLEPDPMVARAIARLTVAFYLGLPNYVNNLRRQGFGEPDFENGGSDRLVDALVAYGDAVPARVRAHLDAGANHVAPQVLTRENDRLPRAQFQTLATMLHDVAAVHGVALGTSSTRCS